MRLAELARRAGIDLSDTATDPLVSDFVIDSRKVSAGSVFGAFEGAEANGEDFIAKAVATGAVAVVARPQAQVDGAVHIADANPRRAFARLAAQFYRPVPQHVVAVTGTNGKTSTVELTRQIWRMTGERAASIGTLGITTGDERVTTGLTSPDIATFLSNMTGLAREGVTHVAYEASSHGLHQYRSEGLPVAAAGFTNLSRDHLDYHADMDDYFAAKMRLFDEVVDPDGIAVLWADDDPWSGRVQKHAEHRGLRVFAVGKEGNGLRLVSQELAQLGQQLEIEHDGKTRSLRLPLIGAYQAANALVAAGLVLATGGDPERVFDALGRVQPVRGRMERAAIAANGAPVYIDYAHTPDALGAAIAALKPHAAGRLITVFGAGGDRDQGKRPEMGKVAAELSDIVIVTDDNPRSEEPGMIRRAILGGMGELGQGAREIGDRREAIRAAVSEAGPQDIVLVAGKGHEQGQIVGAGEGRRILPFDDVEVARQVTGEAARVRVDGQ